MLLVTCPGCGKKLQVKDELAGKKAKCPTCGSPFAIPTPRAAARPRTGAPTETVADDVPFVTAAEPSEKIRRRKDEEPDSPRPRENRPREPERTRSMLPLVLAI